MMTPVSTRPSGQLSLKDRLSRLNFTDACKLLGPGGAKLIQKGANLWDIKVDDDVFLGEDLFRVSFPEETYGGKPLTVAQKISQHLAGFRDVERAPAGSECSDTQRSLTARTT